MPTQQRKIPLTAGLLVLAVVSNSAKADNMTKSIEDALKFGNGGAVKFDLNYRYENVNQDNVRIPQLNGISAKNQPITANANTARLRLRLGLLSRYSIVCKVTPITRAPTPCNRITTAQETTKTNTPSFPTLNHQQIDQEPGVFNRVSKIAQKTIR